MNRKINVLDVLDNLFWYAIYSLPIIFYVVYLFGVDVDPVSVINFFNENFGSISNIVSDSFNQIFGTSGVLPLFSSDSFVLEFLTYFISCVIIHLAVDFLLFIPRIAHVWMSCFVNRGGASK